MNPRAQLHPSARFFSYGSVTSLIRTDIWPSSVTLSVCATFGRVDPKADFALSRPARHAEGACELDTSSSDMARIDDLLNQISDPKLRSALAESVGAMRRRKKFGLVYEEHLPEFALLAAEAGLAVGSQVMRRKHPEDRAKYAVMSLSKGKAKIVGDAGVHVEPVADLLVVKPFGEPVYPALRVAGQPVNREPKSGFHAVINGENFHALQLLLFGYEGCVDCIYIDPPYNTGDRSWKYNNDFVDGNDEWQHSKWLSMMERRLRLAKKLLAPDGVLVVTIDEHEVSHLGVLLEQIFVDARRQMVTIVNNGAGVSQGGFYRVEEYAYFCFLGGARPAPVADDLLSDEGLKTPVWRPFNRYSGTNVSPAKRPNLVYPIVVDPKTLRIVGTGPTLKDRVESGAVKGDLSKWRPKPSETIDGHPVVWPFKGDGTLATWEANPAGLIALVKSGFARVRKGKGAASFSITYVKAGNRAKVATGAIPTLGREPKSGALILGDAERLVVPKTVWRRARHDAGKWGSRTLRELLGTVSFDYAKSPYAILDTLQTILSERPEAVVLDFFAGSGTTLHSVAMLNKLDGGRRRCILVTNNQVDEAAARLLNEGGHFLGDAEFEARGVCRAVTSPRVRAALTGRRSGKPIAGQYANGDKIAEGFPENAIFFDLVYEDADRIEIGERFDAILPALWLTAGAIGDPTRLKVGKSWLLSDTCRFAVLLDEDRLSEFAKGVSQRADLTHVWLVTDSEAAFARMRARMPKWPIVGMLYRDYLRNFRVNTEAAQ